VGGVFFFFFFFENKLMSRDYGSETGCPSQPGSWGNLHKVLCKFLYHDPGHIVLAVAVTYYLLEH